MGLTARKLNIYTMFKLPLAHLAGLRVKELDLHHCKVVVRHKWINQNPFKSMYWAVQGMAAELSIGALLLNIIDHKKVTMSTLVINNSAEYYKKARGKITFDCSEHGIIEDAVEEAIRLNEPKTVVVPVKGVNQEGVEVSFFQFTWSIKPKANV